MLERLWNLIRRMLWLACLGFSLILVMQVISLYFDLQDVNPTLATAYALTLIGLVLATVLIVGLRILRLPRALTPPALPDLPEASHRQKVRYCKYLRRYLQRLSQNENLTEEHRQQAVAAIDKLNSDLGAHPLHADLDRLIDRIEIEEVQPLLDALNEKASAEIRTCVRDVMLAVTFSPYQRIDSIVVLYRNLSMILRIMEIHTTRPRLREQWLILTDIIKIVVTVNFINAGRNLLESLFSHLPFLGRVVDDIAQGIGAGFLTSASGYAAIQRCSAFKGWNAPQAEKRLRSQAVQFFGDVRDIFTKDVLPNMKTKIRVSVPEEVTDRPGFWDSVGNGINAAVDTTIQATDTLLVKPVAKTGSALGRGVSSTASGVKGLFSYLNIFRR